MRYVGFCNLPAWLAMKALAYADAHDLARFQSAQMYYSLANRDIEREVVPLAEDQGLAILPWSPLAGGLLSGKFDLDKPGPAGARRSTFDFPPVDRPRTKGVIEALREVSRATGLSVPRVALAWLLDPPVCHQRDHRRQDARAACRQPGRQRRDARRRARRPARRRQCLAAGVSGLDGRAGRTRIAARRRRYEVRDESSP